MGLSERMAAARAKKEQHSAERQMRKLGETGEAIALSLQSNRSTINLNVLETGVSVFSDAISNNTIERLLDKPKFKIMYAMVKEHLQGEWMADFSKLIAAVPADRRMIAQSNSWQDWQAYAVKAGMNEHELLQALRVLAIFRDALDRNAIVKAAA